jgi:hypothetical protein
MIESRKKEIKVKNDPKTTNPRLIINLRKQNHVIEKLTSFTPLTILIIIVTIAIVVYS